MWLLRFQDKKEKISMKIRCPFYQIDLMMMKTQKHTLILSMLCLLVYPQLNRQALPVIKLCLNTSKGPVSFGAIGLLLEAEKNRLILIKILSSFKGSTIKSWSLLPILWLLNILLAMLHSLRQQLSYWEHTNYNFIIGGESLNIKHSTLLAKIV